jgi:hypothetical protein
MRQLEFNLTPQAEHDRGGNPWKYRFTDESLVEELDDKRIVYGLWESLFGCWIVDPVSRRSREIIPTWQPLNENGIWRDQWDVRFPVAHAYRSAVSPRWRYEANAAFAGYFSGIPQVARTLVASFEHFQWLGLDLIWIDYQFASFLDDELFHEKQQFVFSCFTLSDATKRSRAWRHEFVTALMTEPRAELLERLSGLQCSKATARALYKLGPSPCSRDVYRILINFLNDHPGSKAFRHADQIPPGIINVLEKLPRELLQTNIISILLRDLDSVSCDGESVEDRLGVSINHISGLFSVAPKKLKTAMTESIRRVRDIDQLFNYMDRWENRLIEVVEFPPPPVENFGDLLMPLTSAAAMREESRQMQNCLADLVPHVLQGKTYFFHWDDVFPATVMLENSPEDGWRFYSALGVENEPLPEQAEDRLLSLVDQLKLANWSSFPEKNARPPNG